MYTCLCLFIAIVAIVTVVVNLYSTRRMFQRRTVLYKSYLLLLSLTMFFFDVLFPLDYSQFSMYCLLIISFLYYCIVRKSEKKACGKKASY